MKFKFKIIVVDRICYIGARSILKMLKIVYKTFKLGERDRINIAQFEKYINQQERREINEKSKKEV